MLVAAITFASIGKVVTFLIMLSILIVLHELGHFIVARRNGVRVNEFALGMGPKLLGWTSPRSGTLYSVRALPIGGYCAMQGEDGKTSEAEQQREFRAADGEQSDNFQSKSPLRRLAIVLAGPIANFALAYAILLVSALAFGVAGSHAQPVIGFMTPNSPAALAGLQPGDRILTVDGRRVTGAQLIARIHASLGKRLDVVYLRNGVRHEILITPVACAKLGDAARAAAHIGCIGFTPVASYHRVAFGRAFADAGLGFVGIAANTFDGLGMLIVHFTKYAGQMSGVIGIGAAATTIQDFGWGPYFALAAMISFALGIFNLLPIPALDGGRAAFIVVELVRGKPIDPEKEALVHIAGFATLMALMLLLAFHDIARIVNGKGVL